MPEKHDNFPVPDSYVTDKGVDSLSTHRRTPTFTMGIKLSDPPRPQTPAPPDYEPEKGVGSLSTHRRTPTFSIGMKLPEPSRPQTPAPPDYEPEKVWITKASEPCFTFGIKHSKYAHTMT